MTLMAFSRLIGSSHRWGRLDRFVADHRTHPARISGSTALPACARPRSQRSYSASLPPGIDERKFHVLEVGRVAGSQNEIVASCDRGDLGVQSRPWAPGLVGASHDFAPDDGGSIVEGKDTPLELTGQVASDPLLVAQGSDGIIQLQGSPDQLSESDRGQEEIPWRPLAKPAQYPRFGPRPNRLADDVCVQEKAAHSKSTGRPEERSRPRSSSTSRSGEARRNSTSSVPVAAGARTTSVSRSCRSREAPLSSSRSVSSQMIAAVERPGEESKPQHARFRARLPGGGDERRETWNCGLRSRWACFR